MKRIGWVVIVLAATLIGCGSKTELFTGLSEREANDIMAELADRHIESQKRFDKVGIAILVPASDITLSIRVLNAAGLPRDVHSNLGEVFKKEGVISTPLEERARYIYALSQGLEATLSQIDGIVTARVHVVVPERVAPGEPVQPASVAVFLKHTSELDPDSVRSRIQQLVISSIPGMARGNTGNNVSIVFVPAQSFHEERRWSSLGPFSIEQKQLAFWQTAFVMIPLILMLAIAALMLCIRADWRQIIMSKIRRRTTGSGEASEQDGASD